MIGFILLAASWICLRLEGKELTVLGFNNPLLRLRQFSLGFLVAGTAVALQQLGKSAAADIAWQLDADLNSTLLLRSLRLNLNSVLYEELLFRGYLFYLALRWLGPRRGVLLGAAVFGIYHWFSYGVIGSPVMMAFVFVLTGSFGLMLGLAFLKTKSIAAPIGLHLGWNLVAYLVFSGGPFGSGILVPAQGSTNIEVSGGLGLALGLGLPLAFVAGTSAYYLRVRMRDGSSASDEALPQR